MTIGESVLVTFHIPSGPCGLSTTWKRMVGHDKGAPDGDLIYCIIHMVSTFIHITFIFLCFIITHPVQSTVRMSNTLHLLQQQSIWNPYMLTIEAADSVFVAQNILYATLRIRVWRTRKP